MLLEDVLHFVGVHVPDVDGSVRRANGDVMGIRAESRTREVAADLETIGTVTKNKKKSISRTRKTSSTTEIRY